MRVCFTKKFDFCKMILTMGDSMSKTIKNIFSKIFVLLFVMVATLTFAGCSISFAWFTSSDEDSANVEGATASVEIYSNGELISGSDSGTPENPVDDVQKHAYQVTLSSVGEIAGTGKGIISFKNTSNVSMLLSVRGFTITYKETHDEGDNDKSLTKDQIDINLDANWIEQLSMPESVSRAYMSNYFYNSQIAPNEEITFIPSLTVLRDDVVGLDIEINVMVEVIAYKDNAYKTNANPKPWDLSFPTQLEGWTAYN